MFSVVNEKKISNKILCSKIKEQIIQNKLKKIIKNLRKISEEDLKTFSEIKVKIFEEKEEEKPEFKIAAPIIGFLHYFEEFKKRNSIPASNNDEDCEGEGEDSSSTINENEEELKQIDSSDFSDDE